MSDDLLPHNPIVLRAPAPPLDERAPGHESALRVGRLADAVIRLERVRDSHATALRAHVEALGGAVDARSVAGRTDLYVALRARSIDALAERVAADEESLVRLVGEIESVMRAYRRWSFELQAGRTTIACGPRPLVMGVVNCTPDSFYEGSTAIGTGAVERALTMVEEGADIIDVGGESTRPGSEPVTAAEEIARVEPVIRELAARTDRPISIDTMKAEVAEAALAAGAVIVNDVTGLGHDRRLGAVARAHGAAVVLMHTRGSSSDMYAQARYDDLVADVIRELRAAVDRARAAGVPAHRIVIDPGIGFAKRAEHSLALLDSLGALRSMGLPILVGTSRKSFIGAVLDLPAHERLEGTIASNVAAILAGAHIIRVHDVRALRRAADLAAAIRSEGVGWIS